MATKLYNSHLSTLLFQCNEYYILDTYISLVHIASEVNSKYLIQTYSDSKANLIALVRKHVNASYKTVYNCLDTLMAKDILAYDEGLNSWILVDMENMTKAKGDTATDVDSLYKLTGYTHIRNFFFTPEFGAMKAREKRLVIYMTQLTDSKASNFHESFSMNLLKPGSSWLKVLKTKCKYYAKYTIEKMLDKYLDLFNDTSEDLRSSDLSPVQNKRFKFAFSCPSISDKKNLENQAIDLVIDNNKNEYNLILNKAKFADVTLSKKLIMHLIRAISNLREWFLKERVVQLIINKYRAIQIHKSRENIKSLPAYAAAVVKSVITEYTDFKTNIIPKGISTYEVGEYFFEHADAAMEDLLALTKHNLSLFH
ncbi:MAG: hypothetical protein RSA29_14605 [Clostridium sp.]|uniref:hypothetical protein n=1 Tax=Clostridium sp. TaxID=1506 RepID=UPI00321650E1